MIKTMKRKKDRWSVPADAEFVKSNGHGAMNPTITPNGDRIYFHTTRKSENKTKTGIWYVDRMADSWSEARYLHSEFNQQVSDLDVHPVTGGHLYYGASIKTGFGKHDIYRSRFHNGKLEPGINIGSIINTAENDSCTVASDESYMRLVQKK